ncbi:hypothetical protein EXE51_15910 [Halorubrum sp. CGM5_25_10-8B]|uniref:Uncharacterized protein n=1 Tax=Halorubrum ezzemoulense TaxID=337243 RepID=A0A256IYS6_HALEZ|nr:MULTISPECIES: hypothetical protein [Halorubrum]OYR61719.1 hypothetical protein DJ80_11950 [Halorubrum ezzemoulense]TKX35157.1 hypothetical protein EXE51_15910 [Halorubrum sp. CGM5_25_10-8B]
MSQSAGWGELLVGAYHQRLNGCEVVSYNNRSAEPGDQMETDVLAIDTHQEGKGQRIYICEVVTHLGGGLYSGTPDDRDGWWMEYSNTSSYHHSLETLWRKFLDGHRYASRTFPDAEYSYQFWAPVVTGGQNRGYLIQGLERLEEEFESKTGEDFGLVINDEYTARIEELQEIARGDTSNYGSPAFRFIQILENLE